MSQMALVGQKARIGILLTSGEAEAKKEDLIDITRRVPARPWLKKAPEHFMVHRKKIMGELSHRWRPPMDGFPGDVSIAEYIKFNYGSDFDIDYIHPKDITEARLKSNDINFLLIYDLLEAFHIEKTMNTFQRFRDALQRAGNVFPNVEYQQLINSKITYYNYLHEKGIPIVPTITITSHQWKDRVKQLAGKGGALAATVEIINEIQRRGLENYICKPEYGQEAHAVQFFDVTNTKAETVKDHFEWNFSKYPGIIIQENIDDFGENENSPELRMYFVGHRYQYTTVLFDTGCKTLVDEGGTLKLPACINFLACKALAMRTVKCMPDVTLMRNGRNILMPKLLTRVDIGCIRNGIFNPWVNEVEFVPSLFIEHHKHPMDSRLAEQMVRITKLYLRQDKTRRLSKRKVLKRGELASFARRP